MWDVTPLDTSLTPLKNLPKHPPNENKDFNSDNSYLPSLTHNMDVGEFTLAYLPLPPVLTSSGQESQFQVSYKQINWQIYPQNAVWDIYYGMYLAAILDSS